MNLGEMKFPEWPTDAPTLGVLVNGEKKQLPIMLPRERIDALNAAYPSGLDVVELASSPPVAFPGTRAERNLILRESRNLKGGTP